jgi:GTP-binding protein EngB required for normal cell division
VGTLNIINKEGLIKMNNTPRKLIDLYLKKQANLEDVIEIITGKSSVQDSYAELLRMEQTPETKFLLNVTKYYYKGVLPKDETQSATQSVALPQDLPQ